jgi:hypothetical protein
MALSFWGVVIKPGKTPTPLKRQNVDASVVLKQVRTRARGWTLRWMCRRSEAISGLMNSH